MDRNKIIIIIILALIVVAYIVFVVYGSVTDNRTGKKKEPKDNKTAAEKFQDEDHSGVKSFGTFMGNWFGRFLPKAEIPGCPHKPAEKSKLLCENLSNVELDIPASKSSFRVIKVILGSPPQADEAKRPRIVYEDTKDRTSDNPIFEEGKPDFFLPDKTNDNAKEENIIILSKGGKLKITCPANVNCRVDLQ